MEKTKLETYIDEGVLRSLRERAASEGREDSEVIEEAISDYLYGRRADSKPDLLERIQVYQRQRGTNPPSEEEATELANEEVHKYREEQLEIYTKHAR